MFLAVAVAAIAGAVWFRYRVHSAEAPKPLTPVDLVFVTGGNGEYWKLAANGARKAAEELAATLHVEMLAKNEDEAEQTKILEDIDTAKAGGVAVSPLNAAAQTELINKLAGDVFVVTFDSDAPDSKRKGYVGTSNFAAGRVCARLTQEALPNGGKVAIILVNETKDNLQDRKGGFQEVLARAAAAKPDAPQIEVVGYLVDNGDDDKCAELIRQTLADHPDVACFIGLNERHGPVMRRVLKTEDKLGKVQIIAFDYNEETLDGIEAGEIFATVAQDPYRYGYEAVRMLANLCRADESQQPIGTTTLSVNVETVRKDNLDEFRTKVKSRQQGAKGAASEKTGAEAA
jgi:ribose transport system substrate-binding protein